MRRDRWWKRSLSIFLLFGFSGVAGAVAQEVTLSLERYDELRRKAYEDPPEPPAAAVPVAFEEAVLEIEVGEARARILQRLTLSVVGDDWQTLPLSALGTLISADLGGLDGVLRAEGRSWSLRLRGEGRHQLLLESVVPVMEDKAAVRPTWRMELELPPAAVVRSELSVPRGVDQVEGSSDVLVTSAAETGRWHLAAAGGRRVELTLLGAAAAPERSDQPLRFDATVATAVQIRRTATKVDAWMTLRIRQGSLEALEVPLPGDLELVDVSGEHLGGWEVEEGRARIQPRLPRTGTWDLHLRFAGLPASSFESPLFAPSGAENVLFFTKTSVRGDGLLDLADGGSGRRIESRQEGRLPPAFRSAAGLALAVSAADRPPRWQVTWAEGTQVLAAQVDSLQVEILVGDSGRAFYQLWAQVRSRGASSLGISPPPGFEPVASRRDGQDLLAGRDGDAIALPLRRAETPQTLYLSGFLPAILPPENGLFEIPMPSFSIPVAEVSVRVLLPGDRGATLVDGARHGSFGEIPRSSSTDELTVLALNLLGGQDAAAVPGKALPKPSGYRSLEASWSALSPKPSPLVLSLSRPDGREEWF